MYQNLKITHADPDHLFLVIIQNWAMQVFVGFVMQGHNIFSHVNLCGLFIYYLSVTILDAVS